MTVRKVTTGLAVTAGHMNSKSIQTGRRDFYVPCYDEEGARTKPEGCLGAARHLSKPLWDGDGIAQSRLRNDHCSERLHSPELIHHLACEDKPR